jgi:Co/Zn/Cd efflux system component
MTGALVMIAVGLALMYGVTQPLMKPALADDGRRVTAALIGLVACICSAIIFLTVGFSLLVFKALG